MCKAMIDRSWAAALVCLVILCTGCVSGAELARERAMREYDCVISEDRVRWISQGPRNYDIYRVNACGRIATYACNEASGDCIKESDDR